jgi:hypothetical protein
MKLYAKQSSLGKFLAENAQNMLSQEKIILNLPKNSIQELNVNFREGSTEKQRE